MSEIIEIHRGDMTDNDLRRVLAIISALQKTSNEWQERCEKLTSALMLTRSIADDQLKALDVELKAPKQEQST